MLPMPSFFHPSLAGELYLERAAEVASAARSYARENEIRPAREDKPRICAFGIDVQIAFALPGASLFVPGAVEDTARTLRWMFGNLDRITSLVLSMDTHQALQIFHPAWWEDAEGKPPAPFTPISRTDVESGKWRPRFEAEAARAYVRRLEEGGKYALTIWPYHALLGGISHALVPALREAALFHAIAREAPTTFTLKGSEPLTESYSVLAPEVTELAGRTLGAFNQSLFAQLMSHDRVYVFGQAKSHCVLSTLLDLRDHVVKTDRALLKKLYVLEDAMSPVPPPPLEPLPPELDFPALAERGIAELREQGMNVVRTTEPIG
ncbi:MAG: nicotinamidase [Deltaproteobacteria bacterium]|nr:nicotinamidase [Deltaproteobacteria bacterium]